MAVTPAPNPSARLRLILWAVVALVGLGAAVGLLVLRSSARPASSPQAPDASGPAATWALGVRRAPGFRLTDQHGKPVSLAAYRGRPVIVTFIDPLCRDYCPLEAKVLNEVVAGFPASTRPAILAVSANPYGNDRQNLYLDIRKWRLTPEWRWAVGTAPRLAAVWKDYGVQVLVTTKKIAGITARRVAHTEAAYVVDPSGHERALYLWPFRAREVVQTLRQLR